MGTSIVVDNQNFATEVLQRSYEKPVLVDFFATWCGPCQMLKPMLEKLVREYDFVLAKLDIDQNSDLASAYGIEGVPDVRVVVDGQVMPGFVGVLPEPQIRQLLAQLDLKSDLETNLEALHAAQASGNLEQTQQLFEALIQQHPDNRALLLEFAQFLQSQGNLDRAEQLLDTIQESEREFFSKAKAIKALIQFQRESQTTPAGATSSHDLDEIYHQAAQAVVSGDYEAALQGFLQIVERDRQYRQDGARKAMIAVFELLGDDHALTKTYRKQLMLTLY